MAAGCRKMSANLPRADELTIEQVHVEKCLVEQVTPDQFTTWRDVVKGVAQALHE
jgi:hypothetical protein